MCHSSFNNHKSIFVVWLFWGIVGFSAQQYIVPPEVKQTSGPRLVKSVGEDEVKLQCNVKYAQTYTWLKNGASISSILPKRYTVKQYRYLQITNVKKSDSGLFVCVAKNDIGRVNCTINFLVEDPTVSPTNITGEKPQFLYPNLMASVQAKHTEGDKFEITCEAKGKPNPVVTWYKDGKVFTGSRLSTSPITPGEYDYNITFTGIDVRDAGIYMCNVSNAYGWLTYSYPISVEENVRSEPQIFFIWQQDKPLYVGENVVIFCRVLTKDPDTKYRWYYSSGKIADKETLGVLIDPRRYEQPPYRSNPTTFINVMFKLKLENLTIKQSGLYGCEAENAIGFGSRQTSLTVTYRPVIPITTGTFTELDTTEPEVSGQGSAKPGNKESWTSRVQYPWVLIGMSVAVVIALMVSAWYCWKIKKARVSSRSRRPDIDSLHPRYEVKNEYVVIPDFN